jgi:hypothetical protein
MHTIRKLEKKNHRKLLGKKFSLNLFSKDNWNSLYMYLILLIGNWSFNYTQSYYFVLNVLIFFYLALYTNISQGHRSFHNMIFFSDRVSHFFPRPASDWEPPTYASWEAGMTGARWGLANFLPKMDLNHDLPDLCFQTSEPLFLASTIWILIVAQYYICRA